MSGFVVLIAMRPTPCRLLAREKFPDPLAPRSRAGTTNGLNAAFGSKEEVCQVRGDRPMWAGERTSLRARPTNHSMTEPFPMRVFSLPSLGAQCRGWYHSSSSGRPRSRLIPPRWALATRRRRFDARVGRVGTRRFGRTAASAISATSRASASSRLRGWLR